LHTELSEALQTGCALRSRNDMSLANLGGGGHRLSCLPFDMLTKRESVVSLILFNFCDVDPSRENQLPAQL